MYRFECLLCSWLYWMLMIPEICLSEWRNSNLQILYDGVFPDKVIIIVVYQNNHIYTFISHFYFEEFNGINYSQCGIVKPSPSCHSGSCWPMPRRAVPTNSGENQRGRFASKMQIRVERFADGMGQSGGIIRLLKDSYFCDNNVDGLPAIPISPGQMHEAESDGK